MLERSDLQKKIIRRRRFGVVVPAPVTLGSDTFTRADSTTTLGTADVGGAWTAQSGTWGITGGKGYAVTGNDGNVATLTLTAPAAEVGALIATDAIQNHVDGLVLRYTDASNFLFMTPRTGQGTIKLYSMLAGVLNARVTSSVVLPLTGASSFSSSVTISASNVVTCLLNGTAVGTTYTLTSTEITAYGASMKAGARHAWSATSTNTAATFDNFYAK